MDEKGEIPPGQAVLHELLDDCYGKYSQRYKFVSITNGILYKTIDLKDGKLLLDKLL